MIINGHTFSGDPEGLEYLETNAAALGQLLDIVSAQGEAAFFYKDTHFIVMPTPTGSYIVTKGHRRHGGAFSHRLRNLL